LIHLDPSPSPAAFRIPHSEIGDLNFHIFQKRAPVFQKRQIDLDLVRFSRIRSDSLGFSEGKIPEIAPISRKLAVILPHRAGGRQAAPKDSNAVMRSRNDAVEISFLKRRDAEAQRARSKKSSRGATHRWV
jgi:hypothetical protein